MSSGVCLKLMSFLQIGLTGIRPALPDGRSTATTAVSVISQRSIITLAHHVGAAIQAPGNGRYVESRLITDRGPGSARLDADRGQFTAVCVKLLGRGGFGAIQFSPRRAERIAG